MQKHVSLLGKRDYILFFVVTLLTGVFFGLFAYIGVDAIHDGMMLKTALDLESGQSLHKEVWFIFGSLTAYIQVFFLWALGDTLASLRTSALCAYALCSGLLYLCWRQFLPVSLALLSVFVWYVFAPFYLPSNLGRFHIWSSVYALLFQALSLLLLISTSTSTSRKPTILYLCCGITASLTFWCRQPVGVFLTMACGAALIINHLKERRLLLRSLVFFALGCLAVHGFALACLFSKNALGDWYFQTIQFPAKWAQDTLGGNPVARMLVGTFSVGNWSRKALVLLLAVTTPWAFRNKIPRPIRRALPLYTGLFFVLSYALLVPSWGRYQIINSLSTGLLAVLPFIFLIWGIWLSVLSVVPWRRIPAGSTPMLISAVFVSVASLLQYMPQRCDHHIFWALTPVVGLFVYLVWQYTKIQSRWIVIGFLLFLGPIIVDRLILAQNKLSIPYVTLSKPSVLRGLHVTGEETQWQDFGEAIEEQYKKHSTQSILLMGWHHVAGASGKSYPRIAPIFAYDKFYSPDPRRWESIWAASVKTARPLIVTELEREELVEKFLTKANYCSSAKFEKLGIELFVPLASPSEDSVMASTAQSPKNSVGSRTH
ncbi:MAG: hypothetical protein HY537_00660 [Deltaproteobacteria bacterium]|nr:hypothetical protein [Deltaproteobacteria bacterium]